MNHFAVPFVLVPTVFASEQKMSYVLRYYLTPYNGPMLWMPKMSPEFAKEVNDGQRDHRMHAIR